MKMQDERKLFYLIASPITNYFKEQGIDVINSLPMVTEIAQRVFDNLKNNTTLLEDEDGQSTKNT